MRKFLRAQGEYFIGGSQILFHPMKVKQKAGGEINDKKWWVSYQGILELLGEESWWSMVILVAGPTETFGELHIVQNKYIRPWSLAPEWQLHRGYALRDENYKWVGCTKKTFDTAFDREYMIVIAKERLEEIIEGKDKLVN